MKHNYHSHTTYCNHSSYSVEELILKAIEEGFETFGISEHMPLDSTIESKYRLKNWSALIEYIEEANKVKKKYKKQIKVLVGLECEITDTKTGESTAGFLKKLHAMDGIDYLILGHHTYNTTRHTYQTVPTKEEIKGYVKRFKEAMDLNVFSQVAHVDCFFRGAGEMNENIAWAAEEISKYAAKINMPLGININGIVDNHEFGFPNINFWKIAAKNGATGILELDAHDEQPFIKKYIDKGLKLAHDSGVKLIHKLDI